jgi:hypothetical protein
MLHFLDISQFACLLSCIRKIFKSYPAKFCECDFKSSKNSFVIFQLDRNKINQRYDTSDRDRRVQTEILYIDVSEESVAGTASLKFC